MSSIKNAKKKTYVIPMDEIRPNPKNEKIHTKENMALIRTSLEEVGYITPILIDEDKNILAGHGRYFVLKEDGVKEIEVTQVLGLSDLQKNKFRIYDNQTARTGKYDNELLHDTVSKIIEDDADFNVSILAIEGLAESFATELFAFDLGNQQLTEQTEKSSVLLIITSDTVKVGEVLTKNNIKYSIASEKTK